MVNNMAMKLSTCLTVFSYLHLFDPVYRECVAFHVALHQAVGTDGLPWCSVCLKAISSSRVFEFPRFM
jgi:hypothetical protein